MKFDTQKLNVYRDVLATTQVQQGYQEFIKLFRYLRMELEKELEGFSASSSIMENRMDFAYFQLFSTQLKEKGLKVQIIFVHEEYQFEVWVSGYNRKIQCDYYKYLKDMKMKYTLTKNPERTDYIIKSSLSKDIDISDGCLVKKLLKAEIKEIEAFVCDIKN